MIPTTRGVRHVVAFLAAAVLAGVLGLVSAAAITRTDTQRTSSAFTDGDGSPAHHRATVTSPQGNDHHLAVDLSSVPPTDVLPLLAAILTAVAVVRIAGRRTTVPATRTGRAPPLR